MLLRTLIVTGLVALSALPFRAHAHDEDLRSGNLPPRIAQISDEVALQRLRSAGVQEPRVIRREDGRIVLQGMMGGRPTTLNMDALRGHAVDAADPSRMIVGPSAAVAPAVTGPQLRQDRGQLSDPALMRDAARARP
jgi:hypothetical protein